ncbi:MAG: ABC transporter permease [Hyphomicrobiaceae bacterium]
MADDQKARFATGIQVQMRSIHALMIRDMMLRYGRDNIGFLWVVLEPMVLTACVLVMYAQLKGGYVHGTHVISMVLTGYMPLTMWRHTSNTGVFMFRKSMSMLYHRNITLLDVWLARMALEGIGTTAALTAVSSVLLAADVIAPVQKPGHVVAAWLLLWWLGSAVALITACVTELNEMSERLIQPMQYMLVPLSGIFFMVDWMPETLQKALVYNPLTNCIELFRDGFFGDDVTTHYFPWYPVQWALVLTWLGLALLGRVKNRMAAS